MMFSFFKKNPTNSKKTSTHLNLETIVPRIKHLSFLEALKPILTDVELKGGNAKEQTPVTKEFAGDLLISYAFNLPEMFRFVTNKDMKELGINLEEIHQLALSNLDRTFPEVYEQDLGIYKTIVTGDNLEACTMLLPSIWDNLVEEIEGELLLVVPSRDAVYFLDSEQSVRLENATLSNQECLNLMCSMALDVKLKETTHSLSDYMYCWQGGKWLVKRRLTGNDSLNN